MKKFLLTKDGTVVADSRMHTLTPGDVLIYFWKQ
jgi:hypothetical protein